MMDRNWELLGPEDWPVLERRSKLYRLIPKGFNTPYRESLASYFVRIADAHCLQPAMLAWEILFPERYLDEPDRAKTIDSCWKYPSFNGIGDHLSAWLSRLEALTTVEGLESLTMSFLRNLVSHKGLVADVPRWCPACFAEDRQDGVPYERLLWSFKAVKCCPLHGIKLIDHCTCNKNHHCNYGIAKSLPGICPRCAVSLDEITQPSVRATKSEIHQAMLVADLLACGHSEVDKFRESGIPRFLSDSISLYADGNAASFGRMLGVGKSTLHGWLHGNHVPDFEKIILIAQSHGCSLEDVFTGRSCAISRSPGATFHNQQQSHRNSTQKGFDPSIIIFELNEILKEETAISLREAGVRLGLSSKTLRNHHPDICKEISARWKAYRMTESSERRSSLAEQVRRLAVEMANQGLNPTYNRLRISCPPAASLVGGRELIQNICTEVRAKLHIAV